jgi:guanylate kinase
MTNLNLVLDLAQAQRLRALIYNSGRIASQLNAEPTTENTARNIAVDLARDQAGDKQLFKAILPLLNEYIKAESKTQNEERKTENEQKKAENRAQNIAKLKARIEQLREQIKTSTNPDKLKELLSKALDRLKTIESKN